MMNDTKQTICSVCEKGTLVSFTDKEEFYYKNTKFVLKELEFSRCNFCGTELVIPEQARRNESRIRDEHRKIDGLLTGPEIKHLRKRFNITQAEAAVIFGGGANAFSKYERGDVIQSTAMDRLLRLVNQISSIFPALLQISDVKIKSAQAFVICDYGKPCEFGEKHNLTLVRAKVRVKQKRKERITAKNNMWYDEAINQ